MHDNNVISLIRLATLLPLITCTPLRKSVDMQQSSGGLVHARYGLGRREKKIGYGTERERVGDGEREGGETHTHRQTDRQADRETEKESNTKNAS